MRIPVSIGCFQIYHHHLSTWSIEVHKITFANLSMEFYTGKKLAKINTFSYSQ